MFGAAFPEKREGEEERTREREEGRKGERERQIEFPDGRGLGIIDGSGGFRAHTGALFFVFFLAHLFWGGEQKVGNFKILTF